MASSFLVHRTAHVSARAATGGPRSPVSSQQPPLLCRVSPSYARSPYASPVVAHTDATASSSAPLDDASRMPLDLLEPAAARWASTAGRGGRRAPRVRSTLGPQSEVVDTGVFVCPNTVVAALYSAAPGRGHVVVTAESGGWLRVREQQTGAIRHQQQLRDGGEVSCLAWASAADDAAVAPFGAVVVAGQLSGLISFYVLVGESLVELPSAMCVFHEAPLLSCLPLRAPASSVETASTVPGAFVGALLSLDADGVVALWCLQMAEAGEGAGRGGEADTRLSVLLLDSRYASLSPPERFLGNTRVQDAEEASLFSPFPPVVMTAAALSHPSSSPCCVLSTHRFVQQHLSAAGAPSHEDEETDAQGSAVVFLSHFTTSAADPNATVLAANKGTSTSLEEGAPIPDSAQPRLWRGWEVLRAYRVPVALLRQRGCGAGAASADAAHVEVAITALCVTGSTVPAGQLWAGTADGRLLIWKAQTGQFLRCLCSASAAPVHSLTSVPSPGSPGQALVWASQADGSVVAWSAETFNVAEVLPVSYPPSGPLESGRGHAEDSVSGGDPANVVVMVRDAVDLLRATRHRCAPSASSAPWRRGCGFTLFVKPMDQVCMQRAWSVATDGTVRTWLLPTGSASADGAVTDTAPVTVVSTPTSNADGAALAASLDVYTVQCYLQDRADALVRERQAQRLASEAQQEQLQILQERNSVLAAALQQAISRLERVGVDALVRSASRPGSSSSTASLQNEDGANEMLVESTAPSPGSLATTSTTTLAAASDADEQIVMAAQPATAVAMPEAAPPPPPPLATLPPMARMHLQTLQQLLEELHTKLEESWSRNDALREELLVYQLRTLDLEEKTGLCVRAIAAAEADVAVSTGGAEGQTSATGEVAATAMPTPAPPPLLPSLHTATSPLSVVADSSYAQEEDRAHSDRPQTPPPLKTAHTPNATRAAAMDSSTPSRVPCSPSVEELVHWRVSQARPLTPPPPLWMLPTESASYTPSVKPHATSPSPVEASLRTSTAAERFFKAASAMLHSSTITCGSAARREGSVAGQTRVPAPPLLLATAEEDVQAEEDDYAGGDGEDEPALLEAWCTSEGDLSPIPRPGFAAAGGGVTSTDASAVRGGPHEPLSSSLFSFPFTSDNFSAEDTAGGGGGAVDRLGAPRDAWPPTRGAAAWTMPASAAGRGNATTDYAWARAPAAPSRRTGSLATGSAPPAAVGTGVVRRAPMRCPSTTSAAASPPRAFRSPIIYRQT
ncbi:conserved hypothetical protein [Leishmania mexicana MHOM/GT/2001/U1103]|uniref:Guanine nucleotide-binding protein subunit beta-like protein n=1 Tax=Leishmania mexicana (strain MHOM/GT/2001/U1103) TaxID=929439 RepID=E9AUS7_LEIMU|nr:conserved hypothetical protein [Leishmania mexicana MHOM/GT/2001/U1103]CBZ26708.1 conserved hypothetical protein [Leishmania mexicana MHOM/GT/2001/U1103]